MGNQLLLYNHKVTFDFASYLRERDELACLFRSISADSAAHRQRKSKLQLVNGASGVAAGVAGAVGAASLLLAPATMGTSLPVAGVATIVNTSLTAASVTSTAASYGFSRAVDKDIEKRLHNLRHVIECIARKDGEANAILSRKNTCNACLSVEGGCGHKTAPALSIQACEELYKVWEKWDELAVAMKGNSKNNVAFDLPLSIMQTQGLLFGTRSVVQGARQIKDKESGDDDIELALTLAALNIDAESKFLRGMEDHFRYFGCIRPDWTRRPRRGRLTYIEGGGGCSRTMIVRYRDGRKRSTETEELRSDSSNCVRLPEGSTGVKVHFEVQGGSTVKKVDRSSPAQPWVKSANGKYEVDVFDFDDGDGVDAAFVIKGTLTHSWIEKAWDFGRPVDVKPRQWEWWKNAWEECKEVAPDIEMRAVNNRPKENDKLCNLQFAFCGCLRPDAFVQPAA